MSETLPDLRRDGRPLSLVGSRAVVTGVSQGIGRSIALALAAAGADVAGIYHEGEAEPDTAAQLDAIGVEHHIVAGDTARVADIDDLASAAVERWGGIDIWVNNAARLMVKPLVDIRDEEWHGLLGANLHGYFYGCRAAARQMQRQEGPGRIINVSSASDVFGVAHLSAYTAAKGAIVAMSRVLARELAPDDITVNALAPGAIETPRTTVAWTDAVRATSEERIGLGRIGHPDEIADACIFLASNASRYMTGQELLVDGGLTINGTVGHAAT